MVCYRLAGEATSLSRRVSGKHLHDVTANGISRSPSMADHHNLYGRYVSRGDARLELGNVVDSTSSGNEIAVIERWGISSDRGVSTIATSLQ